MKSIRSLLPVLTAALILQMAFAPNTARAVEIIANNSTSASCSNTNSTCYTTIKGAIDAAFAAGPTTYTVRVEPGTYAEKDLDLQGVTVQGREAARTIISGGGSGTLVKVNTSTGSISSLTFEKAVTGIDTTAAVEIRNCIFKALDTAISNISLSAEIVNNVFYNNKTAIITTVDNPITNNIFMSNTVAAIASSISAPTNITYNDFYSNYSNGADTSSNYNIASNPSFVDAASNDFHLKSDSPCIGYGSGSIDMGAYGRSDADTIPFKVSGVTGSSDDTTQTITMNWNANLSYQVTGYHVYYGTTSGDYTGTDASEGASPITVTTNSATLSALSAAVASLAGVPVLNTPEIMNESLGLSWSAVDGATGYRVYYDVDNGTSSAPAYLAAEVPDTSYTLTGLTNGVTYKVAVSAISQGSYYIAVTAIDSTGSYDPGVAHESTYSDEVEVSIGETLESDLSNIIADFPEFLVAYPELTNKGQRCFIATAAFGYYSAPEVQALRKFRDRYLLTNSAGSAFVRWYYEHGPAAAAYLDAHPAYKPVVRAALMPAVGAALVMTKTPFFIRTVVILFILMIALIIARRSFRRKLSGSGGPL